MRWTGHHRCTHGGSRCVEDDGGVTSPDPRAEGAPAQPATEASLLPRRVGLFAATATVALTLDVITKVVAVAVLEGRDPVRLLGGGLYLVLYRNPGAAFSLATGLTWLLTLIAVVVVIAIVRLAPRLRSPGWASGLGLVLGGALGNLVDRFFRSPGPLRGHVVDFLSLLAPDGSVWPVFNLADSAIVSGGALLVLLAMLGRDYDGTTTRQRRDAQ
ncbi:MAG: signal peptidase II [Pseudonocardiaceae bacterium]|nr:signal peptidase II [Pseudonocardiaceae bacterium]